MATFEDHLRELEEIVRKLESGDLPLEDSLTMFERGTELSRLCKDELDTVEARIQVVTRGSKPGSERVEDLAIAVAEGESDFEDEEDEEA